MRVVVAFVALAGLVALGTALLGQEDAKEERAPRTAAPPPTTPSPPPFLLPAPAPEPAPPPYPQDDDLARGPEPCVGLSPPTPDPSPEHGRLVRPVCEHRRSGP